MMAVFNGVRLNQECPVLSIHTHNVLIVSTDNTSLLIVATGYGYCTIRKLSKSYYNSRTQHSLYSKLVIGSSIY